MANNPEFLNRMAAYLEVAIKEDFEYLKPFLNDPNEAAELYTSIPNDRDYLRTVCCLDYECTAGPGSPGDASKLLNVLRRVQLHSTTHWGTCFKTKTALKQKKCRLRYPRMTYESTRWNKNKLRLEIKRAHPFSAPHNAHLMACLPSNHDIQLLLSEPERARFKAIYVCDYNTKPSIALFDAAAVAEKVVHKYLDVQRKGDVLDGHKKLLQYLSNALLNFQQLSSAQVLRFLLYDDDGDHYSSDNFQPLPFQLAAHFSSRKSSCSWPKQ